MDNIVFSILLVLIGIFVGIILVFIVNYIRKVNSSKQSELMLEIAKKDAEKIKRDYL